MEWSETEDEDVWCGGGSGGGTGGDGDGHAVEDEELDALLRVSTCEVTGLDLEFEGSWEVKGGIDFLASFTGCSRLSNSQLKLSRNPSKSVVSDGEKRSAEDGKGGG